MHEGLAECSIPGLWMEQGFPTQRNIRHGNMHKAQPEHVALAHILRAFMLHVGGSLLTADAVRQIFCAEGLELSTLRQRKRWGIPQRQALLPTLVLAGKKNCVCTK